MHKPKQSDCTLLCLAILTPPSCSNASAHPPAAPCTGSAAVHHHPAVAHPIDLIHSGLRRVVDLIADSRGIGLSSLGSKSPGTSKERITEGTFLVEQQSGTLVWVPKTLQEQEMLRNAMAYRDPAQMQAVIDEIKEDYSIIICHPAVLAECMAWSAGLPLVFINGASSVPSYGDDIPDRRIIWIITRRKYRAAFDAVCTGMFMKAMRGDFYAINRCSFTSDLLLASASFLRELPRLTAAVEPGLRPPVRGALYGAIAGIRLAPPSTSDEG